MTLRLLAYLSFNNVWVSTFLQEHFDDLDGFHGHRRVQWSPTPTIRSIWIGAVADQQADHFGLVQVRLRLGAQGGQVNVAVVRAQVLVGRG